jgi:hypothetical protein
MGQRSALLHDTMNHEAVRRAHVSTCSLRRRAALNLPAEARARAGSARKIRSTHCEPRSMGATLSSRPHAPLVPLNAAI